MSSPIFDGLPREFLGLLADLIHKVKSGKILVSELEKFLKREDPFEPKNVGSVNGLIWPWREFYRKYFGIELGEVEIPAKQAGFDRLIIVAEGLTLNKVYEVCEKYFPCYRYADNLDKSVSTNDRPPSKRSYAVWVRDRMEADEELANMSAYDLKSKNVQGITLLERMLLELKYWSETGKHLDIHNWTLCSGSFDSGSDVPYACWDDGKFRVLWGCAEDRHASGRTRQVVTL